MCGLRDHVIMRFTSFNEEVIKVEKLIEHVAYKALINGVKEKTL